MQVIFSAIAAIFTAIGFAASTAAFLANTVISLGLSLLNSYINKPEETSRTAFEGDLEAGADTFCKVVYGIQKRQGQLVHYNKYGSGNNFNQFVFILSNGWCDGLEPYVIINDKRHGLIPLDVINNEVARYNIAEYSTNIEVRFYDGRPDQEADPVLVSKANPSSIWDNDSKLSGLCYVSVTHKFSADLYKSGIPAIEWIVRGIKCYDWRKDGSLPGGSGTHRLGDVSTYEFSQNPAVQRFNYELGLSGLHSGKVMVGIGKPLGALDLATYTFSANVCDFSRAAQGGPASTYICGLTADSNVEHRQILDAFDNAMAGYGVERNGLSGVLAGAVQLPVGTLTQSDIRADAPIVRQPRKSRANRINILSGVYRNPDGLWELDSYNTIESADALAIDKVQLPSQFDLPQVPSAEHAQYVADIRYRQGRYMDSVSDLPVSLRTALKYDVGDWINYDDKVWLITATRLDGSLNGYLSLSETNSEIYNPAGLLSPPVTVPPTPSTPASVTETVTGLTISQSLIEGDLGRRVPALVFGYDVPDDPTVVSILFEYGLQGDPNVIQAVDRNLDGSLTVTEGVFGGQIYEVRATFETDPPRTSVFTFRVATQVETNFASVEVEQFSADIREILDIQSNRIRDLEGALQEGLESQMLVDGNSYLQREVLQARTTNALAAVVSERVARIEGDEALSEAIISAVASFDEGLAGGLFKVEASAGPAGVEARISLFARAGTGLAFEEAGMFLDVVNEGTVSVPNYVSRVAFDTEKFTIGNDGAQIFTIIDNEIVVNAVFRSVDNKFRLDPLVGQILISD